MFSIVFVIVCNYFVVFFFEFVDGNGCVWIDINYVVYILYYGVDISEQCISIWDNLNFFFVGRVVC